MCIDLRALAFSNVGSVVSCGRGCLSMMDMCISMAPRWLYASRREINTNQRWLGDDGYDSEKQFDVDHALSCLSFSRLVIVFDYRMQRWLWFMPWRWALAVVSSSTHNEGVGWAAGLNCYWVAAGDHYTQKRSETTVAAAWKSVKSTTAVPDASEHWSSSHIQRLCYCTCVVDPSFSFQSSRRTCLKAIIHSEPYPSNSVQHMHNLCSMALLPLFQCWDWHERVAATPCHVPRLARKSFREKVSNLCLKCIVHSQPNFRQHLQPPMMLYICLLSISARSAVRIKLDSQPNALLCASHVAGPRKDSCLDSYKKRRMALLQAAAELMWDPPELWGFEQGSFFGSSLWESSRFLCRSLVCILHIALPLSCYSLACIDSKLFTIENGLSCCMGWVRSVFTLHGFGEIIVQSRLYQIPDSPAFMDEQHCCMWADLHVDMLINFEHQEYISSPQ